MQADASEGFPPVAGADARVLILGSLPGVASLAAAEYYAHPQNAFWPIMNELVGACGSYAHRCEMLIRSRIALWDVLKQSVRPGSMDADIRLETAEANDFSGFFAAHRHIERICFNGKKAEQMFRRFVEPTMTGLNCEFEALPSTSPAYAAMSFADKLESWRGVII